MEWLSDNERYSAIEENLKIIRSDIFEVASKCGRNPDEISLMAVTKTVESKFINHAIKNGVSLILANTPKGVNAIEIIKNKII